DSIRKAVKTALGGVPHQLGHCRHLREAVKPGDEADRHAQVPLKKRVRGIRPIAREVEGRDAAAARDIRGYGAAVHWALTDGGRPPLEASGLRWAERRYRGRGEPGSRRGRQGLPKELTRRRAILAKATNCMAEVKSMPGNHLTAIFPASG